MWHGGCNTKYSVQASAGITRPRMGDHLHFSDKFSPHAHVYHTLPHSLKLPKDLNNLQTIE